MPDNDAFDPNQPHDARLETVTHEEIGWTERPWAQRAAPVALVVATFLLGALASLVLGLAWGVFEGDDVEPVATEGTSLDGGTEPSTTGPDSGDAATTGPDSGDAATTGHHGTTRLARCVSAESALHDPLGAAKPALDQWAVHVGAMNQLVVGEITLQQATEFWERTRLGAQRHVEDFREAVSSLRARGLDCPSPGLLAPGARTLPGCARQVEADVRVLRAAGSSIDTWDHHIHQMDMLRLGELSPEEATRAWLSMWQQGVRDLDAYRAVAREAQRLDGCSLAGQAG